MHRLVGHRLVLAPTTGRLTLSPFGGGPLVRIIPDGANRDRTGDLLRAKQALSQLSYGPLGNRVYAAARCAARPRGGSRSAVEVEVLGRPLLEPEAIMLRCVLKELGGLLQDVSVLAVVLVLKALLDVELRSFAVHGTAVTELLIHGAAGRDGGRGGVSSNGTGAFAAHARSPDRTRHRPALGMWDPRA